MNDCKVFVGLGYHQASVPVCVPDAQGHVLTHRRCRNDWRLIAGEAESCGRVVGAAIESCCGAANLKEVDWTSWMEKP